MKNSFVLFVLSFFMLLFTSCEKGIDNETNSENVEINFRSATCLSCDAIEVNLKEVSKIKNCITSILTLELIDPDCSGGTRHMVFMDDELVTFFTSTLLEIELEYCEDEVHILEVMGYNKGDDQWNANCFKVLLSADKNIGIEKSITLSDLSAG